MGAMKAIDTELQGLDFAYCDLSNRDDVFDLVVDSQLMNHQLSSLLMSAIRFYLEQDSYTNGPLANLSLNDEFVQAMEFQRG